ncbi:hypothetical protein [Luteimonas sp. R10]|uniref:hypothetical protein n=1 Tax=Luteimonas sp. R10 TaxID=3108176 RepID=UPI00308956EE|nr:hypothetical protein U3649_03770 [Luteimonas sp. R10]
MTRGSACIIAVAFLLASAAAFADNREIHTFAGGQSIPATLTLYSSDGDPPGRRTPIFSNYRPKVDFGDGREVICMFSIPQAVRTIAPGETADVSLSCKESVAVRASATRFLVVEGDKKVGFGDVRLPPPAP